MSRLVIELTDRCNLQCQHCYDGRHAGRGFLSEASFEAALDGAKREGIRHLSLTGGEPTLHPRFADFLRRIAEAGFTLGFVSNGWDFARHLPAVQAVRASLTAITFSLDGASAERHDAQRGPDSYRRVLAAAALCRSEGLPFSINFTVTRQNAGETEALLRLARDTGAMAVRLIAYLAHPRRDDDPLQMSTAERIQTSLRLSLLRTRYDVPGFRVGLSPGFLHPDPTPCGSLRGEEFNLDWLGRLDICCHLSGRERGQAAQRLETPFASLPALQERRQSFVREREAAFARGEVPVAARFACDHCLAHWQRP